MFPKKNQEPTYNTAIQVVQLIRLLEDRSDGQLEISKIADELGVHARTVKRYVEAIGEVITGADQKPLLERVRVGRTPYAKVNRPLTQTMSITLLEYASLRLATSSLNQLAPETFGHLHAEASAKVESSVTGQGLDRLKNFDKAFVYIPYGPKKYDEQSDRIVHRAITAVTHNHPATIVYEGSKGNVEPREIEPLSVVLYRDALYIYARQKKPRSTPNQHRYFAVDRIQKMTLDTKKTFKVPDDYDPNDLGKHSLGIWNTGKPEKVVLTFSGGGAQYVRERSWPSQKDLKELEDGSVELEMEIPITPEVITWLAGWGNQVRVEEPEELIDRLRNHLADALDFYV